MELVPVKSFDSYVTANIWMGRLEEENIVCRLMDEYSVTINPALTNSIGGIKLCVAKAQLERCKQLISEFEAIKAVQCPTCLSFDVGVKIKQDEPTRFIDKILCYLLGDAALPQQQVHVCGSCKNEFDGINEEINSTSVLNG